MRTLIIVLSIILAGLLIFAVTMNVTKGVIDGEVFSSAISFVGILILIRWIIKLIPIVLLCLLIYFVVKKAIKDANK